MEEKRGPGNTTDKVDRDMLHEFLWKYRDRSSFMPWEQGELGEMLGVSTWSISMIFKELQEKGAVKKMGRRWKIIDPDVIKWGVTDVGDATLF